MTSQEYKTARRELGMTQRQLAEVLGVTRATVNRRESAGGSGNETRPQDPTHTTADLLADAHRPPHRPRHPRHPRRDAAGTLDRWQATIHGTAEQHDAQPSFIPMRE